MRSTPREAQPDCLFPLPAAPLAQYRWDREFLNVRILTTTSSLLGLMGIQADPLRSCEHILISKIFEQSWTSGKDLDLASLIQMIQSPPLQRIGVFDLESFYPAAQRMELAMMFNNLLAAPGFELWLQGEPLDVGRMLHGGSGKPRMSIFHIAHLSDTERMFFVTLLLNQTLAWMRSQPGTTSLRAIFYMDEVFGYFPPVSEPPSKKPLLTLFKQARAYGLGITLATQNPVDLDYKGLANAGTWFIGRLQTERDRERLIDGLGSADGPGAAIDRHEMLELIANLKQRSFLMQNAHEDDPVVFASRWALSYLPGPLTRDQIRKLREASSPPVGAPHPPMSSAGSEPVPIEPAAQTQEEYLKRPPAIPAEVRQYFLRPEDPIPAGGKIVYFPSLFASAQVQLVNNKNGVSSSQTLRHSLELKANMTDIPWDQAAPVTSSMDAAGRQPVVNAAFQPVPTTILQGTRLQRAQRGYIDFVQRESQMVLWKSSLFKVMSQPEESERDFRVRLQQLARERRDFELNRLRQKYAAKMDTLKRMLMAADQRLAREQEGYGQQKMQTAISVGASLLGALMGRKAISAATLGRATTAARQASRMGREKEDVQRASEEKALVEQQIRELEQQLSTEADQLATAFDPQTEVLQQIVVRATKADVLLQDFGILWIPRQEG